MYKPDTAEKDTNWKEFWVRGSREEKEKKKRHCQVHVKKHFNNKINEGVGQDDFPMSLPTSTILIPQLCNCSDGLRHK